MGSVMPREKPQVVIKEVCCCNAGAKDKAWGSGGGCLRKKTPQNGKSSSQTENRQSKLEAKANFRWKHILLKVKNRKRMANGKMGNIVQAQDMITDQKCVMLVDPQLLDDRDLPGLQKLLRQHVELAPSDVSLNI